MTFSQHIATASILSKLTGIPIIGFAIGIISHCLLDSQKFQEYKFNLFNFKKNIDIVILEILLSLSLFYFALGNKVMIYAVIGGVLPDLIDGILSIVDRKRYMEGNHLFWFHRPNSGNNYELSKRKTIVLSLILAIIVFIMR